MRLYMVPAAPNPTKVMLYVAEKEATGGLDLGIEQVVVNTLKNAQNAPEHLARNPFGTLPVLEIEDRDYLIESLSIIEYLEERYPEPPMWGTELRARARAREIERIADVRALASMAGYVHAVASPLGLPPNESVAAQMKRSMESALRYLDTLLADGRSLLAGDRVTVGDCTLQAALQFMRFAKVDLPGDYPHVSRWDQAYRERPAARSVLRF